ncbi:MAG: amidohydrolase family protein [Elusimicrobia bacterium]|nr:amidohydrolase family protein [Elusimicrobiota bacterium]
MFQRLFKKKIASWAFEGGSLALPEGFKEASLVIERGKIQNIETSRLASRKDSRIIDLEGMLVFPGFINAHDHLEFGLYPVLARRRYQNYVEWTQDIHEHCDRQIKAAQAMPLNDRLWASAYRNLLSGATSVIHHNPWHAEFDPDFPVRVMPSLRWGHSLEFDRVPRGLTARWDHRPFVIHLAEGVDDLARREVETFLAVGNRPLRSVLIHGIAIDPDDPNHGSDIGREAGLIWCPRSNMRLYGATARIGDLKNRINIMLGTDSELTSPGDIFGELKAAQETGFLTDEEILASVTKTPAKVFNWRGLGALLRGYRADLIVIRRETSDPWNVLFNLKPSLIELILKDGEIMVASETMMKRLQLNSPPFAGIGGTAGLPPLRGASGDAGPPEAGPRQQEAGTATSRHFSRVRAGERALWVRGPLTALLNRWRRLGWLTQGFLASVEPDE